MPEGDEVVWNIYWAVTGPHDPEQMQGLAMMRRSKMMRELMQFLQAVHCMWTALLELAVLVQPLRDMLEDMLKNKRRTQRVADKVEIKRGVNGAPGSGVGGGD